MAVTICKQAFTYVNIEIPSHTVQTLIAQWSKTAKDYTEDTEAYYEPAAIKSHPATREKAMQEHAMRRRDPDKSSPDDYNSFMSPTGPDLH